MKQVINVTIGGVVFAIEEGAHTVLSKYLEAVQEHFKNDASHDEIVQDIEASIAEKFIARKRSAKKSVSEADVQAVMAELGKVADFDDDSTHDTQEGNTHEQKPKPRKLYRDTDDVIIAGVASGLAKYFDIDVAIVRIVFVITLVVNGFGFLVYVILWIALQKAETPSQKMAMKGRAVNLDSVKAYIDDKLKRAEEIDKKEMRESWNAVTRFAHTIMNVIRRLMPVILVVVGSGLIVAGLIGIFGITLALFIFYQSGFSIVMDPVTAQYFGGIVGNNSEAFSFALALYGIAFVPLWLMGMLGNYLFSCTKNRKKESKKNLVISVFTLALIWMLALSYAISQGVTSAHKVGSYIHTVEQMLESNPNASFSMQIKDKDDGDIVLDLNWQDEIIRIGGDADILQIPFGIINEDGHGLIGGDAAPGSPLDNVTINGTGTEPFWSFEYREGKLVWSAPAMDEVGEIVETTHDVGFARNGTDYNLWGLGDSDIAITITEGACSDGMSDRDYTHKVKVKLSGMEYNGCTNISLVKTTVERF